MNGEYFFSVLNEVLELKNGIVYFKESKTFTNYNLGDLKDIENPKIQTIFDYENTFDIFIKEVTFNLEAVF